MPVPHPFPSRLIRGRLIRRYKRFLADVELGDGTVTTAHVANPGSMLGLTEPDAEVWLSRSANPKRKLPLSWELIRVGDGYVGVNTGHPNGLVAGAIAAGAIEPLRGYETIRREVRYGRNSRIDLLLAGAGRPDCYVEIKSVTLSRPAGIAEFPDSVTQRGTKHLGELAAMARAGHRAVMFFLVQLEDCAEVRIAADIDPVYGTAFRAALAAGVEALCFGCRVRPDGISIDRRLDMGSKA